ncbi:MAG: hypothetical protein ABEJ65_08505 [bacterium]
MSRSLSDLLDSYHQEYLSNFRRYHDRITNAFLGDGDLTGEQLHQGKHFLAHGIVGQFNAKQQLLFDRSEDSSEHLFRTLKHLHDRIVQSIRKFHDIVNEMARRQQEGKAPREEYPRDILRLLNELNGLLETTFDIEEKLVQHGGLSPGDSEDIRNLEKKLEKASQQNTGCPSQGKHSMN